MGDNQVGLNVRLAGSPLIRARHKETATDSTGREYHKLEQLLGLAQRA
jgi:hypothetical protein